MIKTMGTVEYAKLRGITHQAVSQAIKNNFKLPGVKNCVKTSRFHILTVDTLKIPQPAKKKKIK